MSETLAYLFASLPGYHDEGSNNRGYIGWAPGDDYMTSESKTGWNANLTAETWVEFIAGMRDSDPDLNLVADFYFSLTHDTAPCVECDRSGYNPATRQIAEDFYDFAGRGTRWIDKITQDEVEALVAASRLRDLTHTYTVGEGWKRRADNYVPTADEVNAWQQGRTMGHDAISRHILIKARATRFGVFGTCPRCEGNGYVRTGADRLALYLWMLHPRKGASRGWTIRAVAPSQIEDVRAFLRQNFEHHRENRFAWALASPTGEQPNG